MEREWESSSRHFRCRHQAALKGNALVIGLGALFLLPVALSVVAHAGLRAIVPLEEAGGRGVFRDFIYAGCAVGLCCLILFNCRVLDAKTPPFGSELTPHSCNHPTLPYATPAVDVEPRQLVRSPAICFQQPQSVAKALRAAGGANPFLSGAHQNVREGDGTFCVRCLVWRPQGVPVHHCAVCQRCAVGFSHHCNWFGRCVTTRNAPPFALLIAIGAAVGTAWAFFWLVYHRAAFFVCVGLFSFAVQMAPNVQLLVSRTRKNGLLAAVGLLRAAPHVPD